MNMIQYFRQGLWGDNTEEIGLLGPQYVYDLTYVLKNFYLLFASSSISYVWMMTMRL